MSKPVETAKAKLVVVVGPFELAEHVAKDFVTLGIKGYTTTRVDGSGAHGPRSYGPIDGANFRYETIVTPELAQKLLAHLVKEFADRAVTAYSLDVEAVPADHFR